MRESDMRESPVGVGGRRAASPPRLGAVGVAGLTMALLAGCVNLAPHHQRPDSPVASAFAGDPVPASAAEPVSAIDWSRFFQDERLKRLINLALRNNRDLRIAALNIEQARAQYQIRRADVLPSVGVGVTGSRQPDPAGGITSLYTAGLVVTSYELDFFGRIRNLGDAALATFFGTEEARRTVQIGLVSAVATTYLSLLANEELLAVTRQTLATREDSLRLTRLRFENGASSQLDVRLAESLYEAARVALAQQTRNRALDENALVLLIGQPLPADLPAGLPLGQQGLLADLPAGLPSEVLVQRPDVRRAEQQLVAANANIGAARAAFFPRVTLTGSIGTASSELSGLFSGGTAWSFAPQLVLPIFDGGRNRANLEVAQVTRDIAVAQYERAIQSAFREVSDAIAGRASLGEQLRAQQALAQAEQDRFRLADLRYRNGAASFLDVLDAQRSLFAARQGVVQTQAAQVQNLVLLYQVLGGGWTDTVAPSN